MRFTIAKISPMQSKAKVDAINAIPSESIIEIKSFGQMKLPEIDYYLIPKLNLDFSHYYDNLKVGCSEAHFAECLSMSTNTTSGTEWGQVRPVNMLVWIFNPRYGI